MCDLFLFFLRFSNYRVQLFSCFLKFSNTYLQQALDNGLSFIYNVRDTFKNGEPGNCNRIMIFI